MHDVSIAGRLVQAGSTFNRQSQAFRTESRMIESSSGVMTGKAGQDARER
jgi:hypothetical protein